MAELVLNRFKIEIHKIPDKIYLFSDKNIQDKKYYLARYKPTRILENWKFLLDDTKDYLNVLKKEQVKDEEYIYISFFETINSSMDQDIKFKDLPFSLQKNYLKELFIRSLLSQFIIESFKKGVDLSFYIQKDGNKNEYQRFDVVFNVYYDFKKNICYEAIIGVGSTNTFLLKLTDNQKSILNGINKNYIKFVKNNLLIKNENIENIEIFECPIKANAEIRTLLGINSAPKKKFYKDYYELISSFVNSISSILENSLTLCTQYSGIKEVSIVNFEKNKMVFKNNNKDYTTVNGMRDYGPYLMPENIKDTRLLFIYPDSESANKLYTYFSRGYRHFPGLESYVGIPANIYDKKINYGKDLNSIVSLLDKELTEQNYSNIIAICIMPFSKVTATKEQSKIYYQIKMNLLEKNIASQFIHRNKIFEENFHFSLPNIAIAMLAKCGGIPWKLAKPHFNQLTIGFNIFKNKESSFLGSAVFFDNEGVIREIKGFTGENVDYLCNSLIQSITNYKEINKEENVNKVVVHFYKNIGEKELKEIEQVIKNNLGKDSIFAIMEINDTKTSVELCFDLSYESYMPQSGTYIKLKANEYLLFNNLRYWERPINPINQEELPVKIRIYDPYSSFDHYELISQVYEFSRMYWKSLKQKAQPVTIIYSKLIANYLAEFGGQLPDTEISKKRVWFI